MNYKELRERNKKRKRKRQKKNKEQKIKFNIKNINLLNVLIFVSLFILTFALLDIFMITNNNSIKESVNITSDIEIINTSKKPLSDNSYLYIVEFKYNDEVIKCNNKEIYDYCKDKVYETVNADIIYVLFDDNTHTYVVEKINYDEKENE